MRSLLPLELEFSLSWQTCVLGVVMALAVPAIAWMEESALILVLAGAAFVVLAILFWRLGDGRTSATKLQNG